MGVHFQEIVISCVSLLETKYRLFYVRHYAPSGTEGICAHLLYVRHQCPFNKPCVCIHILIHAQDTAILEFENRLIR